MAHRTFARQLDALLCSSVSFLLRLLTRQRMKLWEKRAGTASAFRQGSSDEKSSKPRNLAQGLRAGEAVRGGGALSLVRRCEEALLAGNLPERLHRAGGAFQQHARDDAPDAVRARVRRGGGEQGGEEAAEVLALQHRASLACWQHGAAALPGAWKAVCELERQQERLRIRRLRERKPVHTARQSSAPQQGCKATPPGQAQLAGARQRSWRGRSAGAR